MPRTETNQPFITCSRRWQPIRSSPPAAAAETAEGRPRLQPDDDQLTENDLTNFPRQVRTIKRCNRFVHRAVRFPHVRWVAELMLTSTSSHRNLGLATEVFN